MSWHQIFLQGLALARMVAHITYLSDEAMEIKFGRKQIYMAAVVTLFCSYLLIGFFSDHFIVILFAYVLYGLSVALKSGTLEAEVVLEFEKNNGT
jgi:homoserine acetyltransferase